MYKCVGVHFADFISFFLNIPWKWNNLVTGGGGGGGGVGYSSNLPEPILDPPLVYETFVFITKASSKALAYCKRSQVRVSASDTH